jgi:heptosyltransferase II
VRVTGHRRYRLGTAHGQRLTANGHEGRAASVVIQTAFLGDMVLTTPLIAALAQRGPVDVVGTPANISLLAGNPDVRKVFAYDKRASGSLKSMLSIGRQLRRRGGYDAAYLAQGSLRSAALAVVAGVRVRVGFETSGGRHLYTLRVPYDEDAHHAERLLQLASAHRRAVGDRNGETGIDARPRLYPGANESARITQLLQDPTAADAPLVALAPGSVWATKRWPYYPELAARLSKTVRVFIVGGRADKPLAEAICSQAPTATDTCGKLSLLESAELIRRCAAVVSNDSAPVHLASAMNTPTVAIFGPTVPGFGFGPLADGSEVAGHETLACRPCDRHGPRRCPLGHWRCMGELSVDEVFDPLTRIVPGLR